MMQQIINSVWLQLLRVLLMIITIDIKLIETIYLIFATIHNIAIQITFNLISIKKCYESVNYVLDY